MGNFGYVLGYEKLFVMEALFQPHFMDNKVKKTQVELKIYLNKGVGIVAKIHQLMNFCDTKKNEKIEKRLVFCGGTTNCKGFEERMKRELPDFEIIVDEHYMWKQGVKYFNKIINSN